MLTELLRQAVKRVGYLDAAVIMAFVLSRDKTGVMTASDDETLSPEQAARFSELVDQRAAHKPLAYIIGKREFMGLDFEVNEHTLIPRPETEIAAETALDMIEEKNIKTVLDLCTGSGCIAISLYARSIVKPDITASDISLKALETAKRNAARHKAPIAFIRSDMFSDIDPFAYEMIIANPPYIPRGEIAALPRSVRDYEPRAALDGGADGLDFYRIIAEKAVNYIVLEIGCNQAEDVRNILISRRFINIRVINDLSGHNRVITAQKDG